MQPVPLPPLIRGSVGSRGTNDPADVRAVQHLLNRSRTVARNLEEDGCPGPQTIAAIRYYQSVVLNYPVPDGRVDPDGRMLRSLAARANPRVPAPDPGLTQQLKKRGEDASHRAEDALKSASQTVSQWIQGFEHNLERWWHREHQEQRKTVEAKQPTVAGAKLTDKDYEDAAKLLGPQIEVRLVKALAMKESKKGGFGPDGRPTIAFEGHQFRKYTHKRFDLTHPDLSYRYVKDPHAAGYWRPLWVRNNADHATAWRTLTRAMELDRTAALLSTSWGIFQVMGFNYEMLGFKDVETMVAFAKQGERQQLELFTRYCKTRTGLVQAMRSKDFAAVGTLYNGGSVPGYGPELKKIYEGLK